MQLVDFYDNFLVSRTTTGIDYPVWIIWDEELPSVVGISNVIDHYGYHDDIFFISVEDGTITNTPKIPTEDVEYLQKWIAHNKHNLLRYSKGQCDISEVLKRAEAYVIERIPIAA